MLEHSRWNPNSTLIRESFGSYIAFKITGEQGSVAEDNRKMLKHWTEGKLGTNPSGYYYYFIKWVIYTPSPWKQSFRIETLTQS